MRQIHFQDTVACDVLVVGGGAAGIRAALTAAAAGRDTVLLAESPVGETGSTFYPLSPPWGVLYAEGERDVQTFYDEMVAAAGGCVDLPLAKTLAEESVRVRDTLLGEGLPLRTHASMGLTGCFGAKPRGAVLQTLDAARTQWGRALGGTSGLRQVIGWQAVTLLMSGERAAGVVAMDARGKLLLVRAKAVVLATGGTIGLYQRSYARGNLMGGGLAMAARRGAATVNMEFVQFINGTLAPRYGLNYYQFALVEQPRVLDGHGQPFLERYLPGGITEAQCLAIRGKHGPFSVEDEGRFFDLGIAAHSRESGEAGATILPDATRLTGPRYTHWRAFLAEAGLATDTPMTVAPFAQAVNGGLRMHTGAHSDLQGLCVCGECAGGCHGANRMGGNAILAAQVFGRLAGQSASAESDVYRALPPLAEEEALRQYAEDMDEPHPTAAPAEAMDEVRRIMQTYAFLERDEAGLARAEEALSGIRVEVLSPLGTPVAAEAARARNGVAAARLMVRAMRGRRESRGGHYRTDYPARDPTRSEPQVIRWRDIEP